jgi:hypothetical protein
MKRLVSPFSLLLRLDFGASLSRSLLSRIFQDYARRTRRSLNQKANNGPTAARTAFGHVPAHVKFAKIEPLSLRGSLEALAKRIRRPPVFIGDWTILAGPDSGTATVSLNSADFRTPRHNFYKARDWQFRSRRHGVTSTVVHARWQTRHRSDTEESLGNYKETGRFGFARDDASTYICPNNFAPIYSPLWSSFLFPSLSGRLFESHPATSLVSPGRNNVAHESVRRRRANETPLAGRRTRIRDVYRMSQSKRATRARCTVVLARIRRDMCLPRDSNNGFEIDGRESRRDKLCHASRCASVDLSRATCSAHVNERSRVLIIYITVPGNGNAASRQH